MGIVTDGSTVSSLFVQNLNTGNRSKAVHPFLVVSPKGPADGGDFGPRTPGTTTGGIQEALNALPKGGTLLIRNGNYNITGTITMDGSLGYTLRGENRNKTIISGGTQTVIQWKTTTIQNALNSFFELTFQSTVSTTAGVANFTQTENSQINYFENCTFNNLSTSASNSWACVLDGNEDTTTLNCYFLNSGVGVPALSWSIPLGSARDFGSLINGIQVKAQQFTFNGTIFGSTNGSNVYPQTTVGETAEYVFIGCYWNPITSGAQITAGLASNTTVERIVFISCYAFTNPVAAFVSDGSSGATPLTFVWIGGYYNAISATALFTAATNIVSIVTATPTLKNYTLPVSPAASAVTAGASPYTFPVVAYDTTVFITTVNGLSALTLDGNTVAPIAVNDWVYVPANHTLIATWAVTAPVFEIDPR